MPRALSRLLLGGALIGGGALALVGALAVRGPGVIGIGLAAVLAGCTAAGIAREAPASARGSALDHAVRAAGGAIAAVLVVAGISTVAGTLVAVVAVAVAVAIVGVRLVRRSRPSAGTPATATNVRRLGVGAVPRLPDPAPTAAVARPPAASSSTRALGDEWLQTTAALDTRLAPSVRAALVLRREEVLDELERRDPSGFALWLAAGPARGGDPGDFVHGGPARPGPAADTDAA